MSTSLIIPLPSPRAQGGHGHRSLSWKGEEDKANCAKCPHLFFLGVNIFISHFPCTVAMTGQSMRI